MRLLTQFDEKHPLATAALAVASAVLSWIMHHIETLQKWIALLSGLGSLIVIILTILLKLHAWRHRNDGRKQKG